MFNENQRFLKNKFERAMLFLEANGLCSECKKELKKGWHADHVIPWVKGGRTTKANIQPLCPKCNLRKADEMQMTYAEYEKLDHFKNDFPQSKTVRVCQVGAYNCIIQSLVYEGKKSCSIFLPTGTGKSDVVRSIAIGLNDRKFSCGVWAFSPSLGLQEQLKSDDVEKFLQRIGRSYVVKPFSSQTRLDNPRFREGCVLESFTTQYLIANENVDLFIGHAEKLHRRHGNFPIAIFDESHLYSTDNQWGLAAIKMQQAGVPIVLITGTPYRSDNIEIPGFKTKHKEVSQRRFVHKEKSPDDPSLLRIRKGMLQAEKYVLQADYEYSYSRAWEDDIILKPLPNFVDATDNLYCKMLSEMPKSQNRVLRGFLLHDKTIASCVQRTIQSIQQRKVSDNKSAAIVASLSDNEADGVTEAMCDIHANKIRREFERQAPHLKILVVTSNNNSEDGLIRFKESNYDVLIVKAMGTIGFNCPRIKTVLNLSNYRTLPSFIQLANRGCRNFAGNKHFDLIMPKDKGIQELWNKFKDETGLEIEDITILEEDIYDVEMKEKESDEDVFPIEFEDHNWSLDPNISRNKNDEIIEAFNSKMPEYANILNNRHKLGLYSRLAAAFGDDCLQKLSDYEHQSTSVLVDPNEEEYRLRSTANDIVKEITNELISISKLKYNPNEFAKCIKRVWTCVKRQCGFAPNQSMENISGIDNYGRISDACKSLMIKIRKIPECSDFDYEHFLTNYKR